MKPLWRNAYAVASLALGVAGCTTLPDVKPFADSTAALATAAGTHYHEVASDVASLAATQLPGETDAAFAARKRSIDESKATFQATSQSLDALFSAMTQYSEKLTSLVAAGKSGPQAVQSLAASAKGFAQLVGIPVPAGGAAANTITEVFQKVADQFTQMQAKKSLAEAVEAAQPAVNLVAQNFQVIYGRALDAASSYVRNTKLEMASAAAGSSVIGFHDNVKRNYNDYYQFLNGLVVPFDAHNSAAAWHGFCQPGHRPCQALVELEAVGLVEARMAAIQPIVETYQDQVASIEATLAQRRKASAAVVRSVNAWAVEHQKLSRSLVDGTSLQAFNLREALLELEGALGQK